MLIADNLEKVKEMLEDMLKGSGNINLAIAKNENVVKIVKDKEIQQLVTIEDKIAELEGALYEEKRGKLYKSILEVVEKPLFERILQRTEGNQLKAARILGINRNTMRAKVKKLGISPNIYKQ